MKICYINGTGSISAQKTYEDDFLQDVNINEDENVLFAQEPSYKGIIAPGAIRRMSKGVKMGIYSSKQALKDADIEVPDAIITGTGMGCVEDSEKFLKAIIDNNEQFLTPTSFIQSTHNTVGAQIALGLECKGYNFTYVNGAVSFETALLDAKMQIQSGDANSILVGGIDETAAHTITLYKLSKIIKHEKDKPYKVLNSVSKAVVFGEGANFFVLENNKKENSYATIERISIFNELNVDEVQNYVQKFLALSNLTTQDVDLVVLGTNGDAEFDNYYDFAKSVFAQTPQVYYKHLSAEYNTASSYGFWIAANILKSQRIPKSVQLNAIERANYTYLLLYNQYRGKDHSLTLLKKC